MTNHMTHALCLSNAADMDLVEPSIIDGIVADCVHRLESGSGLKLRLTNVVITPVMRTMYITVITESVNHDA